MAGTVWNRNSHGELLDFLTEETNAQIASAVDAHQSILSSARRGLQSELSQAKAEQGLMLDRAIGTVQGELQDGRAVQQALLSQAQRTLQSNVLAAQGAANLSGLTGFIKSLPAPAPPAASAVVLPPAGGSGQGQLYGTCYVHLLDMALRQQYRALGERNSIDYAVYSINPALRPPDVFVRYVFATWFAAELACRLMYECKYRFDQIRPKFPDFDKIILFSNQPGAVMKPMCAQAAILFGLGPPIPAPQPGTSETLPLCSILPPQDVGIVPCQS